MCPFCDVGALGISGWSGPSGVGALPDLPRVPLEASDGPSAGSGSFCAGLGDFFAWEGLRDAGVFPFARSFSWSSHSPRSMLCSSRCSLSYRSSSSLICLVTSWRYEAYSLLTSLGMRCACWSDSWTPGSGGVTFFLLRGFAPSPLTSSLASACSWSISRLRRSR